jgi:hypothetical protein
VSGDKSVADGPTTAGTPATETTTDGTMMFELNMLIDNEIAARSQRSTSWKQMDLCFKWRLVQDYMQAAHCSNDLIAEIRALLRRNELANVEYNGVRVVRLNALGM